MDKVRISIAEFPLMEYIWEHGPTAAAELAVFAEKEIGWKKNTTYTVVKRLVDRGALKRGEYGWIVTPLVTREEVEQTETQDLIGRVFRGSRMNFLAAFMKQEEVSEEEIQLLKKLIAEKENQ